jgi:hypothetical protein
LADRLGNLNKQLMGKMERITGFRPDLSLTAIESNRSDPHFFFARRSSYAGKGLTEAIKASQDSRPYCRNALSQALSLHEHYALAGTAQGSDGIRRLCKQPVRPDCTPIQMPANHIKKTASSHDLQIRSRGTG